MLSVFFLWLYFSFGGGFGGMGGDGFAQDNVVSVKITVALHVVSCIHMLNR